MKEQKKFLSQKRKKIFVIQKSTKKKTKNNLSQLKNELFNSFHPEMSQKIDTLSYDNNLNLDETNEKIKDNQRHSLIGISRLVLDYIIKKKNTTGNQVTEYIKNILQPKKEDQSIQKNIQRRVYDAINVMSAIGKIKKNKQEIQIINYNKNNNQIKNEMQSNSENILNKDSNEDESDEEIYKNEKYLNYLKENNINNIDDEEDIDEEKYNQKLKKIEELQKILIKKYLTYKIIKKLRTLNNLRKSGKSLNECFNFPFDLIKIDSDQTLKIYQKNDCSKYLIVYNSDVVHKDSYEIIKNKIRPEILPLLNFDNFEKDKENKDDNIFDNNIIKNQNYKKIFSEETQKDKSNNIFNNNNIIEFKEEDIRNISENKKILELKEKSKIINEENQSLDETFNYLKKIKLFKNELICSDTNNGIGNYEFEVNKEDDNNIINNESCLEGGKNSENNKTLKSLSDNNIKQDYYIKYFPDFNQL